ncbi:hypothetical protein NMY22_g12949 [Coprinellus aureogranulatus]|nr:hypothetical protein NMY22_g12949 [Coprinellus aureogranulatus]
MRADPLVGHGRHFGRTVRTFCRISSLITNGLSRTMQLELGRVAEEDLLPSELTEHKLYKALLSLSPGLEERLNTGSDNDIHYVSEMITKGISSARSDDTKSLKSAVVEWITPLNQYLVPPIQRNVKTDRGYHHPRTGELLCPVNLDWNDDKPAFNILGSAVTCEAARSLGRTLPQCTASQGLDILDECSVDGDIAKATRSSNARIHGMTSVTVASLAYIATQVRFALSATAIFSRTDSVTDSEYFYNLVIDLLEDETEAVEVAELLQWWNQYVLPHHPHALAAHFTSLPCTSRQVFPTRINHARPVHADSVIAKIKERRRLINEGLWDLSQNSLNASKNTSDGTTYTPQEAHMMDAADDAHQIGAAPPGIPLTTKKPRFCTTCKKPMKGHGKAKCEPVSSNGEGTAPGFSISHTGGGQGSDDSRLVPAHFAEMIAVALTQLVQRRAQHPAEPQVSSPKSESSALSQGDLGAFVRNGCKRGDEEDIRAFARAPEQAPGAYESKLGSFLNTTAIKLTQLPESSGCDEWAIIIARNRGCLETWALRPEEAELLVGTSSYRKGLTFLIVSSSLRTGSIAVHPSAASCLPPPVREPPDRRCLCTIQRSFPPET